MSYKPIRLQTVSVRTGEQLQTVPVRTVLAYEHTIVELKNLYCLTSGADVYKIFSLVLEDKNELSQSSGLSPTVPLDAQILNIAGHEVADWVLLALCSWRYLIIPVWEAVIPILLAHMEILTKFASLKYSHAIQWR